MKNKVINLLKTLKVDVNLDKWPKELAVYKNDDNVINQMIEQLEYIDDLEEVIEKIEINDYKSLENIFLNAATEQYRVQNNLSLAHYFFNDVNLSTYHYWISKSAENNDLMSYYNIIYDMFLKGDYEKETVLSVNEYLGDCGVYLGYQNLGYLYSGFKHFLHHHI